MHVGQSWSLQDDPDEANWSQEKPVAAITAALSSAHGAAVGSSVGASVGQRPQVASQVPGWGQLGQKTEAQYPSRARLVQFSPG